MKLQTASNRTAMGSANGLAILSIASTAKTPATMDSMNLGLIVLWFLGLCKRFYRWKVLFPVLWITSYSNFGLFSHD